MEGFDFLNPTIEQYNKVYEERSLRLDRIRNEDTDLVALKAYYKEHPAQFISDWGMTNDPRNPEIGLPASIPFILFERQIEYIDWLHDHWKNRKDGLTEKSRDMGASWLCVAFAVWMYAFYPETIVGFGSRKEEYVDNAKDAKSIFWKVRKFIELLPLEFTPSGYNQKVHATFMTVVNPENGASIVGEAGDNIGRGNRTSIYFKDESAFYQRPKLIEAALSQTSNCKIDISTPNGPDNPFAEKRHSGKVDVFTFHWKQDPRKDKKWRDKQKEELDPVVFAQEVEIDYNASTSDNFIDGNTVQEAMEVGPSDVEAIGAWMVGIDAAHHGDDESVVHFRKGRLNLPQKHYHKKDGVELANEVEAELDNLLAFGGALAAIFIELDGPGASCHDQLRQGKYAKYVRGVHTGARLSDDKNFNVRARMWRYAKEYLEQPPVSMTDDRKLYAQLSSLNKQYRDGLLLMESKKEYKKRIGGSPDRADAFVLTFVDPTAKPAVEEVKSNWRNKIKQRRAGSAQAA